MFEHGPFVRHSRDIGLIGMASVVLFYFSIPANGDTIPGAFIPPDRNLPYNYHDVWEQTGASNLVVDYKGTVWGLSDDYQFYKLRPNGGNFAGAQKVGPYDMAVDEPACVSSDNSDRIFVVDNHGWLENGYFQPSIKVVTPSGNAIQTINTYFIGHAWDIATDSNGRFYVIGPQGGVKSVGYVEVVSNTGDLLTGVWPNTVDLSQYILAGEGYQSIAIDRHDNLYAAFGSVGVLKITPDGAVTLLDTNGAFASTVAVDGFDNVYVPCAVTDDTYCVRKYGPDGTALANIGEGLFQHSITEIAVDSPGTSVYVKNNIGNIGVFFSYNLGESAARNAIQLLGGSDIAPAAPYKLGAKGWDYASGSWASTICILDSGDNFTYLRDERSSRSEPSVRLLGHGVDCSGLTLWSYNTAYDSIWNSYLHGPLIYEDLSTENSLDVDGKHFENPIRYFGTDEQFKQSIEIDEGDLRPGDLVFYKLSDQAGTRGWNWHEVMYVGADSSHLWAVHGSSSQHKFILIDPKTYFLNDATEMHFRRPRQNSTAFHIRCYAGLGTKYYNFQTVSLEVWDPDVNIVNKDSWVVTDSEAYRCVGDSLYYSEDDVNDDGILDPVVYGPYLKDGSYWIRVIPEEYSNPEQRFTLAFDSESKGAKKNTLVLAKDVRFADIPFEGYTVEVKDGQIVGPSAGTAPEITLNGESETTVECGSNFTDPGATGLDAEDGTVEVVVGGATVDVHSPGDYVITYNATDSSGNAATEKTRTVHVVDTVAPIIDCPVDIERPSNSPEGRVVKYAPTAMDTCEGNVPVVCDPPSGTEFPIGSSTVVTCTATDGAGNQSQYFFTVTILSELDAFDALIARVAALENDGIIKPGPANAMTKILRNARRSFKNNKITSTCNQLQGFIDLVHVRINSGKLPQEYADALIAAANNICKTLGCGQYSSKSS